MKNKTPTNRQNFMSMRTKNNRIKTVAKKKYRLKEGQEVCNMARKQPKHFWKSIKKKLKPKTVQSERLTVHDLYEHFKSTYGDESDRNQNQQEQNANPENIYNEELDSEISANEFKWQSFHTKNNKNTGTDKLSAEIFKVSFNIVSPFLLKLYNRLFLNGEYPRLWGEGIIVPIFKGGNQDEAGNYRGITLINILGKIYSQILLNRLNKWAEKEERILDNHFGFQKGKSTVDCIFTFYSVIAKTLGAREKLYCVFIDYEKAFDKIDRAFLWQKLYREQVSSKLIKALRSMYTVVKSCIGYQSSFSRFFNSYNGLIPAHLYCSCCSSMISCKVLTLTLMKYLQLMKYGYFIVICR